MLGDSRAEGLIAELPAVSLEQLDERAALLRRTDRKYVLGSETFERLLSSLADDHEVLEIDGRRTFAYESVYFDTPELRCFRDHVEDQRPRFKIRTRLYLDTAHCVFEVKLKLADGETDKRQLSYRPEDNGRMDAEAGECVQTALEDVGVEAPRDELSPSLRTEFERVTLAPREGAERVTCDLGIRLERPGAGCAELLSGFVVVETKSQDGQSPADRVLEGLDAQSTSLSKYRTGVALLVPGAEDPDSPRAVEQYFVVRR